MVILGRKFKKKSEYVKLKLNHMGIRHQPQAWKLKSDLDLCEKTILRTVSKLSLRDNKCKLFETYLLRYLGERWVSEGVLSGLFCLKWFLRDRRKLLNRGCSPNHPLVYIIIAARIKLKTLRKVTIGIARRPI